MTRTPDLVFRVRGVGWDARLLVLPTKFDKYKQTQFTVPWLDTVRVVDVRVRYTAATDNRGTWHRWHIKTYECETEQEARALLAYLRKQTTVVAKANRVLAARRPVEPPWGIVPVYVHYAADSHEHEENTIYTSLGAATDDVLTPVGYDVPEWFAASPEDAKRMVIAASPWVEKVAWEPYNEDDSPATEHLSAFRTVAIALDSIHASGMIHSDIKPDNVQNVVWSGDAAYALIDTDAVTDIDPAPLTLRATPPYIYAGVGDVWNLRAVGAEAEFTEQILRAHDRFGFAAVVLSALAGRAWVNDVLLTADRDPHTGLLRYQERRIEDAGHVAESLRTLWPAERWSAFIDRLVEPFGPRAIVVERWSAKMWIDDLIALSHAVPQRGDVVIHRRYHDAFARIRRPANIGPAATRVARGVTAIRAEAAVLAARQRRAAAATVAAVTTLVALVIAIGIWMGK